MCAYRILASVEEENYHIFFDSEGATQKEVESPTEKLYLKFSKNTWDIFDKPMFQLLQVFWQKLAKGSDPVTDCLTNKPWQWSDL